MPTPSNWSVDDCISPTVAFARRHISPRRLKSRMDPATRMVLPQLSELARKLGVSRSSIKRTLKDMRDFGAYELVYVKSKPEAKVSTIYYKIN